MIERIQSSNYISNSGQIANDKTSTTTSFGDLLRQRAENVGVNTTSENEIKGIQFSKHAEQRACQRGIEINSELITQLSNSVQKAQQKGAKNILAFDSGRAFIINVVQNRVVTAISKDEMQENVFTNIDGAVLLK